MLQRWKAPAKINWFLIVKGLRDDGYHEILSLMQTISLNDEIIFEPSDRIEVITETEIPLEENLIYRAANLLRDYCKVHTNPEGVRITLKKSIPIAAGLGGGSSDAATTLMGLNRFWGLNLTIKDMMKLGASIGSDVPFFFNSPVATVMGRGEEVCPVKLKRSYPLLLVKPPLRVETGWAYSEIDRVRTCLRATHRQEGNSIKDDLFQSEFIGCLQSGRLGSLQPLNDLEGVVIDRYPEVGEIKETLKRLGAVFSTMSGSGPTVIGVFDSIEGAREASRVFPGEYWCKTAETVI